MSEGGTKQFLEATPTATALLKNCFVPPCAEVVYCFYYGIYIGNYTRICARDH